MTIPLTLNHEIQKMLKDRGLWTGEIDGNLDIVAIEHLMFQMGINYAGWTNERKLIAAEELFYETQGIDIGAVDGLDDHHIQHAREVYKAKLTTTWRDKVEEIVRENAPPDTSGSPWAAKYTLTQKALGITAHQYDAYREAVGWIESRNNPNQGAGGAGGHYYGMYQFGTAATQTTSAFLKDSISKEDFESNQNLAEKHFDALSYLNHKALSKNDEYNSLSPLKKLAVLGYAHNQGAGGARKWLQSGVEGRDAFGTSGKKYYDAILAATSKITKTDTPPVRQNKPKQKVEPKYGVGILWGEKTVKDSVNASRPVYMDGVIKFRGFKDSSVNKLILEAGSGGSEEYPSVPFGTYSLSPQGTGSIISSYYENNGLDPTKGAFRTVYNVGTPDDITVVGYDPKVERNRSQIQIHSNVRTDKDNLRSKGCLTVAPGDYPKLIDALQTAMDETDGNIALVVEKGNGDLDAVFTIVPTTLLVPVPKPAEAPVPKKTETKFVFIGDSVAAGLAQVHGAKHFGRVGMPPKEIAALVIEIKNEVKDKIVILSAGLLNNITDRANVENTIRTLKTEAAEVRLVGGPSATSARQDLTSVSNVLESIAAADGVHFLGSYESSDGIHPKSYAAYSIHKISPSPIEQKNVESTKSPKAFSLRDIHINQLKFLRGIGETETGFSKKEAYSETYNQEDNNRNVREYGQKGADYGYYQCNELDVAHAIKLGVNPEIAKHLNGGGKGGKSSVAQQTIAMHEYLRRHYKDAYEALKHTDSIDAWQEAIDAMDGKWFGLKDRPQESKKIWLADWTVEKLWPEVAFAPVESKQMKVETVPAPKPAPKIVVAPKKTYSWPRQSECEDFYGEVGTSQVKCQLPFTMVLAWDTGTKLTSYSCHKLVKEPMERIWNRVYEHYGYDKIVDLRLHMFGGCLNVRKMRGGSSWSMHAWGIAVDIDPERNALHMNKNQASLSKSAYDKYWEFIYDEGAIGLGPERDFDWMHWQFAKL